MNTNLLAVKLSGMLMAMPLLGGCEEEPVKSGKTNAASRGENTVTTNALEKEVQQKIETAAVRKVAASDLNVSPGVAEIIKLAESGVSEEVILAFVENSSTAYELNVEDILYLYDQGLSVQVITAMIRHGSALHEQMAKVDADKAQAKDTAEQAKKSLAEDPTPVEPSPPQPVKETAASGAPAPEYPVDTQPVYVNPYPQQVNYFYKDLAPYGTWVELADYGWSWQPRACVVNRSWRPYCDRGRWVYSDCGWYWQSDYSWGWAPFHYGRWLEHSTCGWVWVPGTVWAPSWVTWRSHDSYCGWAPLPPGAHFAAGVGFSFWNSRVGVDFGFGLRPHHYTFVPLSRLADRYAYHHALPRSEVNGIFNKSTVINNIVVGNNNTIINNGIGYNRVAAATRTEIPKVTVRDLPPASGKYVKPERIEKEGTQLVVYRPQIQGLTPQNSQLALARTQQEPHKDAGATGKAGLQPDARAVGGPGNNAPQPLPPATVQALKPSLANDAHSRQAEERRSTIMPATPSRGEVSVANTKNANPTSSPALAVSKPDPERITARMQNRAETTANPDSTLRQQPVTRPLPSPQAGTPPTVGFDPARRSGSALTISKPLTERGTPSHGGQPVVSTPQPATSIPTRPNYTYLEPNRQPAPNGNASRQPAFQSQPQYRPNSQAPTVAPPNYSRPQSIPQPSRQPDVNRPTYTFSQPPAQAPRPEIHSAPSQRQAPPPQPVHTPSYRSESPRQMSSSPQPVAQPSRPSSPSAPVSRPDSGRNRDNR